VRVCFVVGGFVLLFRRDLRVNGLGGGEWTVVSARSTARVLAGGPACCASPHCLARSDGN